MGDTTSEPGPVSAELGRGIGGSRPFSITQGPFSRVLSRLHGTRADGTPRAWMLVAVTWVPLFVGALLRVAVGRRPAPILFDLSVHGRLLIAIPLVIQAERIFAQRCRETVRLVFEGNFAAPASVDRIIERAERLRDARVVELALVALSIAGGQAMLWGLIGSTGMFAGLSEPGGLSFARVWYAAVAWPIAQLLFLRWLWHWSLWAYVLARLSRLPLATVVTHPDHAAGLGFLGLPIAGFAVFVSAFTTITASAWATQILAGRASVESFAASFVVILVAAVAVGCGPLMPFSGILYRARLFGLAQYHQLALDYVRAFHRKWVETHPPPEPLLGTPDLQSLNDLIGAFSSSLEVRLVAFSGRQIIGIWIAAAIPMLPLVATVVPVHELLRHLGGVLLGGLPV